jgi:hypothetical protein
MWAWSRAIFAFRRGDCRADVRVPLVVTANASWERQICVYVAIFLLRNLGGSENLLN